MKDRKVITLLLILGNIFLLPSIAQISQGAENEFAAGSDSIEAMQGNNYYQLENWQSKSKPDSVLGWVQQNLPTIPTGSRGATRKDPSKLAVSFSSEFPMALLSSIRVLKAKVGEPSSGVSYLCSSINDPKCAPGTTFGNSLRVDSVLGNCAKDPESACVEAFSMVLENKSEVLAKPFQEIPVGTKTFPGEATTTKIIYPAGLSAWIWEVDVPGAATKKYLLRGTVTTLAKKSVNSWDFQKPTFNFEVIPISSEVAPVIAPRLENFKYRNTEDPVVRQVSIQPSCLAHDVNICYHREDFPKGARVNVKLKLPNTVTGWLNGRLVKPNVSTQPIDNFYDRVAIDAGPSENIIAGGWVDWEKVPEALFLNDDGTLNAMGAGRLEGGAGMYSGSVGAIESYLKWQQYLGEKALLKVQGWTISSTVVETLNSCEGLGKGLQGVVASNASAYSPGAPTFDKESQTLDYRVAAPHFAPDGSTENLGTYGLSMRADLVQCLYGVKEVPAKAEISITSVSTGGSRVSTVALYRNGNWVYLSADGFTFSAPTLKVKLIQPEPPKVEVASPATNTATPEVKTVITAKSATAGAKKIIITCTKGKLTKMVSGTNPKCPTGYKKK